jgi:hypothetical protein
MGDGRGTGGSEARGQAGGSPARVRETAEERASGEAAGAVVRATRLRTTAVGTMARPARRAGGREAVGATAARARRSGWRRCA